MQDKFVLHLTDEEAVAYLQGLIDESVSAIMAVLVEQFHKMAQVSWELLIQDTLNICDISDMDLNIFGSHWFSRKQKYLNNLNILRVSHNRSSVLAGNLKVGKLIVRVVVVLSFELNTDSSLKSIYYNTYRNANPAKKKSEINLERKGNFKYVIVIQLFVLCIPVLEEVRGHGEEKGQCAIHWRLYIHQKNLNS